MSTLVIVPPNKLLCIDKLYAFIGSDETGEGLISMQLGNTHMPLVAADMERVESLRVYAQQVALISGKIIKLVEFSVRTELETFDGTAERGKRDG